MSYEDGYSWDLVASDVEKVIDDYLLELNKTWDNNDNIIVRIAQIESRILDVKGIQDVGNATINGRAENLKVDKDAIVSRGTINE